MSVEIDSLNWMGIKELRIYFEKRPRIEQSSSLAISETAMMKKTRPGKF